MKYIKVFESWLHSGIDLNYIKNSIDDIFIELKDEGMLVKTYHHLPYRNSLTSVGSSAQSFRSDYLKKEVFDIVIKGKQKYIDDHVFTIPFEVGYIKSYVETLIDFMSEFCPDFDYKFEEYDIYENIC